MRERGAYGWWRKFAAKGGTPRGCATGEWELQNADANAASAGAATGPLFLSFCR
jgi:hypothetical protein